MSTDWSEAVFFLFKWLIKVHDINSNLTNWVYYFYNIYGLDHGLWTPRESFFFFQRFEIFGLGQTNWAEDLWGIWAMSGQTIGTVLALWVTCPWESVAGPLSYKRLWFLGLEHITPKIRCGPYRIWSAASVLPSSVGWIHEKSQENLENLRLGKTEVQ